MFHRGLLAAASMAGLATAQELKLAKAYTGWDCCKPTCANGNYNQDLLESRGVSTVCDASNNPLTQDDGLWADSGCSSATGTGFLCANYQPIPVLESLSYGFAIQIGSGSNLGDNPNCCRCYLLEWMTGEASELHKEMVVQVLSPAAPINEVVEDDFVIYTPGGGVGPNGEGCRRQYGEGYEWGDNYGGHGDSAGCEQLPPELAGGCYWRFNWARGDINGWDIVYRPVECPARLTDISGCVNNSGDLADWDPDHEADHDD